MSSPIRRGRAPEIGRSRRLVLVFLALLQFLIAVDVTVVNIALPAIGGDLGVDARHLTWVVTGYTVVGGGLLMAGGRIADLFGRRRTLLVGAVLFGVASLGAGVAPSLPLLVLARFGQGAGEALALPAAMSLLALLFPGARDRSRALGVWAAVASSGLVLGFLVSGLITELLHWRWIFLVNPPLVAVVVGACLLLLPRDGAPSRAPVDLPGAALLVAAPLLLIFGVIRFGDEDPDPALAGVVVVAGLLCVAAFPVVERRTAHPLVPLPFLRHRERVLANGATALFSAALSTTFFLMTLHLQEERGLTPIAAGAAFLPLAVTLVVATVVVPSMIARLGFTRTALLGMATTGLGIGVLALTPDTSPLVVSVFPGTVLVAFGMGVGLVALQNAALRGVTDADAGVASGVQRCADQLGGASGIALYVGVGFSPLPAQGTDPFLVSYGLALVGIVLAVATVPLLSRRTTPTGA
ncbi:MFS transporter [Saccharothrix yanglingensis]|uniref:MFS transporter n=1 Tax=Saccharothrix yanglingensis TaxID=659496 RepID=A0ABU0X3S4_9PSEU|nr:MFS transporter [Saccharothrix yanglingensis]MDQ2586647.1 MFS transporter [Saccharothrix yanglingensis]